MYHVNLLSRNLLLYWMRDCLYATLLHISTESLYYLTTKWVRFMKFKEIILFALLPVLAIWVFQNVFFKATTDTSDQAGQRFTAPQKVEIEVHKPLNTEIDFLDTKPTKRPIETVIDTDQARYEFSSAGAVLSRVEFLRNWGGKRGYLSTVFPVATTEREKGSFLVAFNEQTPYYFNLLQQQEEPDRHILAYESKTPKGSIRKTFEIFKKEYRIDLMLEIFPSTDTKIRPRIFWISPYVTELGASDVISGLISGRKGVQVVQKTDDTLASYWMRPTLFGTQDRYFIHAMVKDPGGYVERGYFKTIDLDSMFSILEGPEVSAPRSWQLTFYVGPKEDDAMRAVDPRLIDTLNYGLFGFISKPLSQFFWLILEFIYGLVRNYGWAIIIFTILFKLILLPFTFRAEESMKRSGELQKKLQHAQTKYKDDPQALAMARAELMKKHGMPMLGGCSVLLLQLPIIWALSILLSNSFELYKAPFLWIPDLTAPDPLYILPILAALGIALSSQATDMQQRISSLVSAVILGAVLVNFSSGIALYIAVSTLFSVAQSYIVRWVRG